jgi:phosphohistidine phosphatase
MQLVLIRHARAEERALFKRDRTRALTGDGRRRMRKAARGLQALVPGLTGIATSPLLRARQTAEIVATACNTPAARPLTALAPGGAAHTVLAWLRAQPADATLALVGHEPDLGLLAGWLLCGDRHGWRKCGARSRQRMRLPSLDKRRSSFSAKKTGFVQFKKGAAAMIEFTGAPAAGKGALAWLLTAAQLGEFG